MTTTELSPRVSTVQQHTSIWGDLWNLDHELRHIDVPQLVSDVGQLGPQADVIGQFSHRHRP